MRVTKTVRLVATPMIAMSVLAAAPAAAPLTALNALQPGQWQLSSRDGDFAKKTLCLSDARVLIQLRQPGVACSHFVIANDAQAATVHYTCPGNGHGRTTIRVETPRLAQVDTQGIADNAPFDMTIEARRLGECQSLSMR